MSEYFLAQEIGRVHAIDSRPVLVTDSGEFSSWVSAQRASDHFGASVYRGLWFPNLGLLTYPIPPWAYAVKDRIVRAMSGRRGETIVAELQAEAWFQGHTSVVDVPLGLQAEAFPPSTISNTVQYARETGFAAAYLWGVEWWYWMEANGYPEYLAAAKALS